MKLRLTHRAAVVSALMAICAAAQGGPLINAIDPGPGSKDVTELALPSGMC